MGIRTDPQAQNTFVETCFSWKVHHVDTFKLPQTMQKQIGHIIGVGVGEEESVAAAIGGVLIAGSSIPVWVRARAAQLAAGATGLEERLTMLEQRHREQMAEFAQAQADHVADLEERVDFAERLLSKQREQLNS